MNQDTRSSVPGWYWVIAVLALLWNLMGCAAFAMELFAQEAMMETWTEAQREWARSLPSWIYVVYGVAVGTGLLGSIGLLARKGWAVPMFAISLVAVLVQMIYSMGIAGGVEALGASSLIMPTMLIFLSTAWLWFSRSARGRNWIGA